MFLDIVFSLNKGSDLCREGQIYGLFFVKMGCGRREWPQSSYVVPLCNLCKTKHIAICALLEGAKKCQKLALLGKKYYICTDFRLRAEGEIATQC